jgi:hypothetical protein
MILYMKKSCIAFVWLLLLSLVLTGCRNIDPPPPSSETTAVGDYVTSLDTSALASLSGTDNLIEFSSDYSDSASAAPDNTGTPGDDIILTEATGVTGENPTGGTSVTTPPHTGTVVSSAPTTTAATHSTASPPTIVLPSAPGVDERTTERSTIDFSNISRGYFTVRYSGSATRFVVRVTPPGDVQYTYDIPTPVGSRLMAFPLSRGSGAYTVTIHEGVAGSTSMTTLDRAEFTANIGNEHAPFLMSNYFVNYNADSAVVTTARQLAAGCSNNVEVIQAVYNWFVDNIEYCNTTADRIRTNEIQSYVPDLGRLMREKRGICFDYASGMVAMLRSRGIPARLEVGYAGAEFHAWISAWTRETGWVNGWIRFSGSRWSLMDPTFAAGRGDDNPGFREFMNAGNHNTLHYY